MLIGRPIFEAGGRGVYPYSKLLLPSLPLKVIKLKNKPENTPLNLSLWNKSHMETLPTETEISILFTKQLRVDLDPILQRAKEFRDSLGRSPAARHAALSVTALEDAILRWGMTLKELGAPNPYPNSRDTSNTIVDPTADGMKM